MKSRDLKAIKARCEAATPGPWQTTVFYGVSSPKSKGYSVDTDKYVGVVEEVSLKKDAEFIAHAREDVPKLVAEVEQLQSRIRQLEG